MPKLPPCKSSAPFRAQNSWWRRYLWSFLGIREPLDPSLEPSLLPTPEKAYPRISEWTLRRSEKLTLTISSVGLPIQAGRRDLVK